MVGRRYWVVQRLISVATENWEEIDGYCALRGFDPIELPFDRFLNLVYAWLIQGADKEGKKKIDDILRKPPVGVKAEVIRASGEWAPGAAGADFMAQLALRGGAGRVSVGGNRNVVTS